MTAFWVFAFASLAFWRVSGAAGTDPPTASGPWWAFLAVAAGAAILAFSNLALPASLGRRARAGCAILAALAAIACPFPWCVPPAFLAAGAALAAAGTEGGGPGARGLSAAGALLSLQSIVVALGGVLLARRHEVPFLGEAVAAFLSALGIDAAGHGAAFSIRTAGETIPFSVRFENLLAPAFAILAATGAAGRILSGRRRAAGLLGFLLAVAAYALARFAAVSAAYAETPDRLLFLSWPFQLATIAPLGLALLAIDRGRAILAPAKPAAAPAGAARQSGIALALASVAAGVALLLLAWHDPASGARNGGRILFDDSHGKWEPVGDPFGSKIYGSGNVYTYRTMADFLRLHYPDVGSIRERPLGAPKERESPLEAEIRSGRCDVLVLKVPTKPYSTAEQEALRRFVDAGGGLWLLGDHTNVFGSGTYLNAVARPFGIQFKPDATADLEHGGRQLYRRPAWFAHPIVSRMEPMLFATSDSLAVRGSASAAIVGRDLYLDDPDYSVLNFFGDFRLRPDKPYGLFVQCAARRYGSGRVVAFTDSTLFSNFSFHFPGVESLAMGTIEWLNRRPLPPAIPWSAAMAGIAALAWGAWRLRAAGTLPLAAVWAGVALAGILHAHLAYAAARPPAPRRHVPRVAFWMEPSGGRLPTDHDTHEGDPDNYHTLFVSLQRIGLHPFAAGGLADALRADAVVIPDPVRDVSDEETAALRRYLESGGRVLLMDWGGGGAKSAPRGDNARYHPPPSPAAALAGRFHLAFGSPLPEQEFHPTLASPDFKPIRLMGPMEVFGGTSVLAGQHGARAVASRRIGKGLFVAFGGSRAFSVAQMGTPMQVPTPLQQDAHRLAYWMFARVLGVGKWGESPKP